MYTAMAIALQHLLLWQASGQLAPAVPDVTLRRVSALADQRLRFISCAAQGGIALLEADVEFVFEWGWGCARTLRTFHKHQMALPTDRSHRGVRVPATGVASSSAPRKVGLNQRSSSKLATAAKGALLLHRSHKLSLRTASVGAAVLVLSAAGEVWSWFPGGGEVRRLELFREKRCNAFASRVTYLISADGGAP
jgi:hypothetical protein